MPLRPGFADEAITELKSIAEQAGSTRVHTWPRHWPSDWNAWRRTRRRGTPEDRTQNLRLGRGLQSCCRPFSLFTAVRTRAAAASRTPRMCSRSSPGTRESDVWPITT
jgi:hypothetical protein